jgi:hypothetical protein
VSKHSGIRDCFGSGMATVPSTQTQALDSRNEETCSGTVQDARRLYLLLTLSWVIMLKIDWFSFSNQITRVLVVQVYLTEVQTEIFSLNFLFSFAYSLLRAIILPVAYFKKNTWLFLMVWVILYSSINSFVVRNCIFFHTFEKNIFVTVKNWWSLTYGQVYIFWTLIACDVFYLKRYKADRYAFATFHIYIICLKCPLWFVCLKSTGCNGQISLPS